VNKATRRSFSIAARAGPTGYARRSAARQVDYYAADTDVDRLGIGTRVELACIVVERSRQA
jgi:hypothetical protein